MRSHLSPSRTRLKYRLFSEQFDPPRHRQAKTSAHDNWLDKWLLRLSHFSQFGLFLFTIGTIYFTVIPLYQKALLEEAIAKKEVELEDATATLSAMETSLRKTQEELTIKVAALDSTKAALAQAEWRTYVQKRDYELRAFVAFTGADCSDLLHPPLEPQRLDDTTKRREPYETAFDIQPAECLMKIFQKSRLHASLEQPDLQFFDSKLRELGTRLLSVRANATKEVTDLPGRAKRDLTVLRPARGFDALMDEILSRVWIIGGPEGEAKRKVEFERAVTRTRNVIAYEYLDAIRREVLTLRDVVWPSRPSSAAMPTK